MPIIPPWMSWNGVRDLTTQAISNFRNSRVIIGSLRAGGESVGIVRREGFDNNSSSDLNSPRSVFLPNIVSDSLTTTTSVLQNRTYTAFSTLSSSALVITESALVSLGNGIAAVGGFLLSRIETSLKRIVVETAGEQKESMPP